MTIKNLLAKDDHRPWDLPNGRWKYYQEWNHAIFFHWEVEATELIEYLPRELVIDLFQGSAWVSLVAFKMERVSSRYLPAFFPFSNFQEINIRTYVKFGNKSGVYFLSIEAGSKVACQIARLLSGLPYQHSEIGRSNNRCSSINHELQNRLEFDYQVGTQLVSKTPMELWLTERYALFQDSLTFINEYEIHHQEWPLYDVEISKVSVNYPRFSRFFANPPLRVHYSPGVQVVAWEKVCHVRSS